MPHTATIYCGPWRLCALEEGWRAHLRTLSLRGYTLLLLFSKPAPGPGTQPPVACGKPVWPLRSGRALHSEDPPVPRDPNIYRCGLVSRERSLRLAGRDGVA